MSNIDYSQDSKVVLFELINAENNVQLRASDFDVSLPEIYSGTKTQKNTSVLLTPKAGTGYYGSTNVFYHRMNLSDIFDSKVFGYNPQTETTLFELIPKLNEVYGINLKEEDLIDVAIPAYDPLHPLATRSLTISATSSSYFFVGAYTLVLGQEALPAAEDDGLTRVYYLVIGGYGIDDVKKSIVSLNFDGSVNIYFDFLVNANEITSYTLDRVERLADGGFVLNGDFSLSYLDENNTLVTASAVKTIRINNTGFIVGTDTTAYFGGTDKKLYEHKNVAYKYLIDADNTAQSNRLYRYDAQTGLLDTAFSSVLGYVPTMLRLMADGRLYAVSPVLNIPDPYNNYVLTDQIRIDRILPDGSLDLTFNTVYIKSSDTNYQVPDLFDLLPEVTGTTLLYFKPVNGLSNSSVVPTVNGNRIVALNATSSVRYTWNPIIRLNADGSTDSTFSSSLQQFDEGTVMSLPQTVMVKNNCYLVSTGDVFTSFTYRQNPLTGYKHVQPLHFNRNGSMHLFAGSYYVNQFHWSNLAEIVPQSNGLILGFGLLQSFVNNGTLSACYSALVRYSRDTSIDKVLWRSPGPTGTSNPIVERVFMDEV